MDFKNFKDFTSNDGDIVITIPSIIEWSEYEKELEKVVDENEVLNFKISNIPTKTKIGDRCYICYRSNIVGWMKIVGFIKNSCFNCTTTNKAWSGNFIQRSGVFHKLENPIPMKGFQGFRYLSSIINLIK